MIGNSKVWAGTGSYVVELLTQAPYSWNKYEVQVIYGDYRWEKRNAAILSSTRSGSIEVYGDAYRLSATGLPNQISYTGSHYNAVVNGGDVDRNSSSTLVGKYVSGQMYDRGGSYFSYYGYLCHCTQVSEDSRDKWTVYGTMYYYEPGKGDVFGYVTDASVSAYPNNGRHTDGFWYTNLGREQTEQTGSFVGVVHSDNPDAYPANGKHTDGYWYVRI